MVHHVYFINYKKLNLKITGYACTPKWNIVGLIYYADNPKQLINGTPMLEQNRPRKWLFLGEQKGQVSAVNSKGKTNISGVRVLRNLE